MHTSSRRIFIPLTMMLGQQLAGPADKRLAEAIFVGPGGLAEENQPRAGIADAENGLPAAAN